MGLFKSDPSRVDPYSFNPSSRCGAGVRSKPAAEIPLRHSRKGRKILYRIVASGISEHRCDDGGDPRVLAIGDLEPLAELRLAT